MTTWLFRLVVLFLCFSVEVKVRAATWLEDPKGCQIQEKNCVLRAEQEKSNLQSLMLTARQGAVLVGLGGFRVKLIRGSALVDLTAIPEVATAFGSVRGRGLVVVERKVNSTRFTCLDGEVEVALSNGSKAQVLTSGFWVEMQRLGSHEIEIVQTLSRQEAIALWWSHFLGSKSEFKEQVRRLIEGLSEKAEKLAIVQSEMIQRSLASQAEADRLKRERAEREAQEQARMRALFRKENYIGEGLSN